MSQLFWIIYRRHFEQFLMKLLSVYELLQNCPQCGLWIIHSNQIIVSEKTICYWIFSEIIFNALINKIPLTPIVTNGGFWGGYLKTFAKSVWINATDNKYFVLLLFGWIDPLAAQKLQLQQNMHVSCKHETNLYTLYIAWVLHIALQSNKIRQFCI